MEETVTGAKGSDTPSRVHSELYIDPELLKESLYKLWRKARLVGMLGTKLAWTLGARGS